MPTDDELKQHPLFRHVRGWRDKDSCSWWGLGDRKMVWSKQSRFRADSLRVFLADMSAHEILTLIRKLDMEKPQC